MKTYIRLLACFSLALAGLAAPALADREEFHWTGSLEAGQTISVAGFRGNIRARQTDGPAVVNAIKQGTGDPARLVDIQVEEGSSGVKIVAVYPKGRDEDDIEVRVDWQIEVPKGVKLVARTEIGDVTVRKLDAPVEASSAIGDLDLSTSSYAWGKTVNGSIKVEMGKTSWSGSLSLETVNGPILVKLPVHSDTRVSATSKTGRFETDLFPTDTIGSRYGAPPLPGANVSGTLGRGGRSLKISTINGGIRLLRND